MVAFHEFDLQVVRSEPRAHLYEEMVRLCVEAVRRGGRDPRMGLRLRQVFTQAGLPAPAIRYEAAVAGAEDTGPFDVVAGTVRILLPAIERLGLGAAGDLRVDTLAARMRDEVATRGGVVVYPPLVGAHARRAAAAI